MISAVNEFQMFALCLGAFSTIGAVFYMWFHLEQKAMKNKFENVLVSNNASNTFYITPPDGDGYQRLVMLNAVTKAQTVLSLHFDLPQRVKRLAEKGINVQGQIMLNQ